MAWAGVLAAILCGATVSDARVARPDRGVDAQIEGRTDGFPDGRLLALQIKSGESYFRHEVPGGWRFYVKSAHIDYWAGYAVPVLLVLYDPRSETAYWQLVNPDTTRRRAARPAYKSVETRRFIRYSSIDGAKHLHAGGGPSPAGPGGPRRAHASLAIDAQRLNPTRKLSPACYRPAAS